MPVEGIWPHVVLFGAVFQFLRFSCSQNGFFLKIQQFPNFVDPNILIYISFQFICWPLTPLFPICHENIYKYFVQYAVIAPRWSAIDLQADIGSLMSPKEARHLRKLSILAGFSEKKWSRSQRSSISERGANSNHSITG